LVVNTEGISIGSLSVQVINEGGTPEIIGCESYTAGVLGFLQMLRPDVINALAVDFHGVIGLLNLQLNFFLNDRFKVGRPPLFSIGSKDSPFVTIEDLQRHCDAEDIAVVT
jgi:hypothetical protein